MNYSYSVDNIEDELKKEYPINKTIECYIDSKHTKTVYFNKNVMMNDILNMFIIGTLRSLVLLIYFVLEVKIMNEIIIL
jgi:hypothetical protein